MWETWSYLHWVSRCCSVIRPTGNSLSCRSRWGKHLRGWAEGHLATPKKIDIGPSCSILDGNSWVGSHHCANNACKNKVHVNGPDDFVNMSKNEHQRLLSLDCLVHCDLLHDDIADVNDWSSTVAKSDGMVHAEAVIRYHGDGCIENGCTCGEAGVGGCHRVWGIDNCDTCWAAGVRWHNAEWSLSVYIQRTGCMEWDYIHRKMSHQMQRETGQKVHMQRSGCIRILCLVRVNPWEWRTWWNPHIHRSGYLDEWEVCSSVFTQSDTDLGHA